MAKEEKDRTQGRVKDSLAEINSNIKINGYHLSKSGNKITSLGTPENLTQSGRDKSIETRRKKALENPNNKRAHSVICLLKMKENASLNGIATFLNKNEFLTSQGKSFSATQVSNLMRLYEKL